MFEKRKNIVFLTKDKVVVTRVVMTSEPRIFLKKELAYKPETLVEVFKQITKAYGFDFRLLLDESLIYTTSFIIPSINIDERLLVKEKTQKLFPESLDEIVWDFKDVLIIKKNEGKNVEEKVVQVVGLASELTNKLRTIFKSLKIYPEAIEPISISIVRLLSKETEPLIIIYKSENQYLLIVAFKGLVITSQVLKKELNLKVIKEEIALVKASYQLEPRRLILIGQFIEELTKEFQKDFYLEQINLDPQIGLALKKDIIGEDKLVLNLNLDEVDQSKQTNKKNIIIYILIILIIAFFIFGVNFFTQSFIKFPNIHILNNFIKEDRPIKLTPTGVEQKKTIKINKKKYPIEILNGSGREGVAIDLKKELEKAGFKIENTGNADNYDYEKTTVLFKNSVETEFKTLLNTEIKKIYSKYVLKGLDSENKYSVTIIVGKN